MARRYRLEVRLGIVLRVFAVWAVLLTVARVAFIVFQGFGGHWVSWAEFWGAMRHGVAMDLSVLGYVAIPVCLLMAMSAVRIQQAVRRILVWYLGLVGIIVIAIVCIDAELYRHWQFRLDLSAFRYLDHPKEALASVPIGVLVVGLLAVVAVSMLYWRLIIRWVWPKTLAYSRLRWWQPIFYLNAAWVMVLPIRGGMSVATMNAGSVYFCNNNLANHAALNPVWTLIRSVATRNGAALQYAALSTPAEEQEALTTLMERGDGLPPALLRTERPNVLVVLMESQSAQFSKRLGGIDAMPCFDSLAQEGVLFSRIYSASTRSERGIVAVMAGYPGQGKKSIIHYPAKLEKLAFLPRIFDSLGYSTAFYYGGNADFANFRSCLLAGGMQQIYDESNLGIAHAHSKWGIPDEYLFARVAQDADAMQRPFFWLYFTLSNHEPYDLPNRDNAYGSESERMVRTARYADSCLGDFVRRAKRQPWWQNTLLVVLADHGHYYPNGIDTDNPERYHIPMLWLGGALADSAARVVERIGNQYDLPATLLAQMGVEYSGFPFSRDVFTAPHQWAMPVYNDGFLWIVPEGWFAWDNDFARIIRKSEGELLDSVVRRGKAFFAGQHRHFWAL